jgi:hypothetical protein
MIAGALSTWSKWLTGIGFIRAVKGAKTDMDARDHPRLVNAINAIVDDAAKHMARAVVVARGIERLRPILEGDESPAERCRRENASALIEMALGDTPMQVAKRLSKDPNTRHRFAQRFRRLLREKK